MSTDELDKLQKLCDRVTEANAASMKSSNTSIWAHVHREPELARNARDQAAGAALPKLLAHIRTLQGK